MKQRERRSRPEGKVRGVRGAPRDGKARAETAPGRAGADGERAEPRPIAGDEELAAAAGRAGLRLEVAKQHVRLAKEELKRARKRFKEAKREVKRARKRAAAARKAWKQARRSTRGGSQPSKKETKAALAAARANAARRVPRSKSVRRGART